MSSVLALDASRYIGYAFFKSSDAKPMCRTWRAKDTWLTEDYGNYFAETEAWLLDMLATFSPDVLAFESPILMPKRDGRGSDQQQVRRLVGVVAVIEKVAYQKSIRCFEVHNQTSKSFMGVAGRRGEDETQAHYKDRMITAVAALGYECADSHQSDAVAIARVVYSELGEDE